MLRVRDVVTSRPGRERRRRKKKKKKKVVVVVVVVVFAYLWCHNNIIINDRKQEEGHAVEEHCGAFYLHAAWPGDTTFGTSMFLYYRQGTLT